MRNKKLIIILSILSAITLLIIINSVLFSVQYINAYCYNVDDANLNSFVLEACEIKKGRSIFLLNENEVIEKVENGVPDKNVKVINIEKKFPNQVYINYVKIEEYLKIESGGKNYYLSNNAVVMRIKDIKDDTVSASVITLKIKGQVQNINSGSELESSDANDLLKIKAVLSALERVMYRATAIGIFEFIDLSGQHESTKDFIYFHTYTGVYFELQNTDNAFNKLELTWKRYKSQPADSAEQTKGTYIMTGAEVAKVFHSPDNRYRDGI